MAELWLNRQLGRCWNSWEAVPVEAWTAPGIAPADGDMARTAVVEAGRKLVTDLTPLMRANGVNFAYPCWSGGPRTGDARLRLRAARDLPFPAQGTGADRALVGHRPPDITRDETAPPRGPRRDHGSRNTTKITGAQVHIWADDTPTGPGRSPCARRRSSRAATAPRRSSPTWTSAPASTAR